MHSAWCIRSRYTSRVPKNTLAALSYAAGGHLGRWTQDDVRAYLPSPYSGGRSGRSAPRADDIVDPTTDAPATDDDVADVTPAPAGGGSTGGGSSTPA